MCHEQNDKRQSCKQYSSRGQSNLQYHDHGSMHCYALPIARKQPAFGFIAQLGRDRWSAIAAHVAKEIHGAVVNNFDTETLEPLVFTRKNGFHPTRMEWRQQASGVKASARQASTSYTVFCPAKNVARRLILKATP